MLIIGCEVNMSLIKCDECGKEISNKCSVCICCGNPIYKEEHTNVVVIERSWVDLEEKEKVELVCEYEKKTGLNMHFTFLECTIWIINMYVLLWYVLIRIILLGYLVFLLGFVGCVLLCCFQVNKIWKNYRGEVSWKRVNASRDFTKWLKASKNIIK